MSPASTLATNPEDAKRGAKSKTRTPLAYFTLLLFSFLYFARPEDVIPGLHWVPVAKISGGIALFALIFGVRSRAEKKWPLELKLLLALFVWECLTVPFAWYIGGALSAVVSRCSKALIVAFLVSFVVNSVDHLRRLLFVQAGSVAVVTFASVLFHSRGRMGGVLGGVFSNPNDLALNIALNWPLCLMFLLRAKSPLRKLLWGAGLLVMVRGLMLTYSRTGFLALAVGGMLCLWEFGIKGKRFYMLAAALLCLVGLTVAAPQKYGRRIGSIFGQHLQSDSQEERKELLMMSLKVTAMRPIFGIGPGNFEGYSGMWRVTHNTYTELSSECGIPALILFLLVMRKAFWNLRSSRRFAWYRENQEARLITGGLWAALAAYVVGAFFASSAYQLFPYFMFGYTTVVYRLASQTRPSEPAPGFRQPVYAGNMATSLPDGSRPR